MNQNEQYRWTFLIGDCRLVDGRVFSYDVSLKVLLLSLLQWGFRYEPKAFTRGHECLHDIHSSKVGKNGIAAVKHDDGVERPDMMIHVTLHV